MELFKERPLLPKPKIDLDEKKLRLLIYGFQCKLLFEGKWKKVTIFQDPQCYFQFNIFFLNSKELFTSINYFDIRNLETENAVNLLSDKRFNQTNSIETKESVEIELHSGQLHLFWIENEKDRTAFIDTIIFIINSSVANPFCRYSIQSITEVIKRIGLFCGGHKEKINKQRLKVFFNLVKVHVSSKTLSQMIDMYILDEDNVSMEEIDTICLLIMKKPELRGLFLEYAGSYGGKELVDVMDYSEFKVFMREKNDQKVSKKFFTEMCYQLKNPLVFLQIEGDNKSTELSFMEFCNVIFSDWNCAMNPHNELTGFQDMTHPSTAYFINTSHNTYLTGQQIGGLSDCRAYYEALQLGCRSIEIDTYDGVDGFPIVTHGRHQTSILKLSDVLNCITKWAFKYAETPLILSFENHCSLAQREKMKEMIQDYFGESIYYIGEKEFKNNYAPSPSKMERKILIKTTSVYRNKKFIDKMTRMGRAGQLINKRLEKEKEEREKNGEEGKGGVLIGADGKPVDKKDKNWLKQQKKLIMADITFLFVERFNVCNLITPFGVCSLNEVRFQKKIDQHGRERIVEHHNTYFSRVYPKPSRVNSSNFNPVMGWGAGAQMVAMNFQNKDNAMLINFGVFRKNGGKKSGWVLKPRVLLDNKRDGEIDTRFKMRVISGQNLGALIPGNRLITECYVYVDVTMVDLISGDHLEERKSWKHITSVTQFNLFHPQWKDMDFIMTAKRNESSYFLFKVIEAKEGTILGRTAIPCDSVRKGYRTVELHDEDMDDIPHARLLVHFDIEHILAKKL